MIEKLKNDLKEFDIKVEEVEMKNLIGAQIGMEGVAYIDYFKEGQKLKSYMDDALNDEFNKGAVSINVMSYPIDEKILEEYKGGTLLYFLRVAVDKFTGNLYKVVDK